jgi:hypothetical protein
VALIQLCWPDYFHLDGVRPAHERLSDITSKRIELHPLSITSTPNSCWSVSQECHHVFADLDTPNVGQSIVHELLHGILLEEGYYRLGGKFPECVHPMITNELDHPEIFRRMKDVYKLNLDKYWDHWASELEYSIAEIWEQQLDVFARYIHFARIFCWFCFPPALDGHLAKCRQVTTVAFDAAKEAYTAANAIGFHTAENQKIALETFRMHWLQFCRNHIPQFGVGASITQRVEESYPRQYSIVVNDRTEQSLLAGLQRKHGLQM